MNILFLDIDGVLNSYSSMIGIGLSFPYHGPDKTNLNPVSVGLLGEVCQQCDLKVYIHSTWCMEDSGINSIWFKEMFNCYGLKDINILDKVHSIKQNRQERISQALKIYKPEKFIILDDEDLRSQFNNHAIHINPENGFIYEHYVRILDMFGKKLPLIFM